MEVYINLEEKTKFIEENKERGIKNMKKEYSKDEVLNQLILSKKLQEFYLAIIENRQELLTDEEYIHNIFGDSMADSIERVIDYLDRMDLTQEEFVDHISDMHELIREGMYLTALFKRNKKLADKIDKANELIKFKRIDEFKKSVANGTHEEFLANLSWTDKSSLKVDMEKLFRDGISDERDLTEEEQKYYDIIQNSINKDLEKEALSQGFDSVEAWRKHNAIKMSIVSCYTLSRH